MRLYLSSYRIGDYPERLVDLCGNRRVAVVGNALDFIPVDARRKYEAEVYSPHDAFSALGLESSDFDLRRYFGNPTHLRADLNNLVWVLGGNAFLLMRALRQAGFPDVVRDMLEQDEITYGGFSAGAVVATPTLRGIEVMDDPSQLAEGYEPEVPWVGMGLVGFSIVPHYKSDHPEAASADVAVSFMKENTMPYKALADGEVFITQNGVGELLLRKSP
ncbi:Type 1 glutamine amidotransferase-like domain-containing protein [Rhizobium mongolense]|uniref:Type 1 glutamine amidotransferase-like domain-containing protein n=1 Tax=Rhizobium mongolense TaxID=57676 RepID=UPI003555FFE0